MGLFDGLAKNAKSMLESEAKRALRKASDQVVSETKKKIAKGMNHSEKFTFSSLPESVEQLQALPEAELRSAYQTAALTMAVLCHFAKDREEMYRMLDVLRGPQPLNPKQKQFIDERLSGKEYVSFSFFEGATPANNYVPTKPYTIKVRENSYSFVEENWATLYVTSSGADTERPIRLRKKPSTNQWFLTDINCLADIRIPVEQNPWA